MRKHTIEDAIFAVLLLVGCIYLVALPARCQQVSLERNVKGNLGVSHLGSGTGANSSTFWRGDGTWASPVIGAGLTGILEGHGSSAITGNAASSALTYLRRKPNVTGTSYEFAALGYQNVVDYQWSQTPGGSISIGGNTVTLTPCPLGVSGSAAYLFVYLSAGTGTAETALVTGGTCTSGAASGTVSFTAAHTHAGAWAIATASGGLREALLAIGNGANVFIPANTTLLVSHPSASSDPAILVDKAHVTIAGAGWSSIIQARASTLTVGIIRIYSSAGSGLTLRDFAIDGNRSLNATGSSGDPVGVGIGILSTGGVTDVLVDHLEIHHTQYWGVYSADHGNSRIEVKDCYIHDNGGVSNTSGGGAGVNVFGDVVDETNLALDVRVHDNYIANNYNTVHTVGIANVGYCIANFAKYAQTRGNVCVDNFNITGGQIGGRGIWDGNTVIHTANQASDDGTSCMEFIATGGLVISNNYCRGGSATGSGIVLEGNPAGVLTVGAQDVTISGNFVSGGSDCISLIDAGGFDRAVTIIGNRARDCTNGVAIYTDANIVNIIGNDLSDNSTFLLDSSTNQAVISGNIPWAANLTYGGSVSSSNFLSPRCGQTLTVTGATTVKGLNVAATFTAGGCTATLIPAAGATWVTDTTSNIGLASTAVVGKALIFTYDGSKWWPSY